MLEETDQRLPTAFRDVHKGKKNQIVARDCLPVDDPRPYLQCPHANPGRERYPHVLHDLLSVQEDFLLIAASSSLDLFFTPWPMFGTRGCLCLCLRVNICDTGRA